jgi:hypothetical protein
MLGNRGTTVARKAAYFVTRAWGFRLSLFDHLHLTLTKIIGEPKKSKNYFFQTIH